MRTAIAASGNHLKAQVNPHFGRCAWFCIYDPATGETEFLENTARDSEKAGCEAAGVLMKKKIGAVVAGRFGALVIEAFRKKGIRMIITEREATVAEVMNKLKK